jgi:two-component system, NarL family, response regulator DevR
MGSQAPDQSKSIRIALLCENPRVYRSLGPRLEADSAFEVVGTLDCVIERVAEAIATRPDVVILGISHITHFNMLVCRAIRQADPNVRVVVLPSFAYDSTELQMATEAGAATVILKNIDTPALVEQIRALTKPKD